MLPFPVDVFPEPVKTYVENCAEATCCPPDFVAVPLLSFLGVLSGPSAILTLKHGWVESSVIWTAIVGDVGTAKSPAIRHAEAGIKYVSSEFWKTYEDELRAWRNISKEDRKGKEEPQPKQLMTTDTTTEALFQLMQDNERLLLKADELIGWLRSFDQYRGKGNDRQRHLGMWSGEAIVLNRVKAPATRIPRPYLCVTGGLQPSVLADLKPNSREDGLMERFLFSYPDCPPVKWTEQDVPPSLKKSFQEFCWKLHGGAERKIGCDNDAKAVWAEWFNRHHAATESGPDSLRGHSSKLTAYCARLIVLLHILWNPGLVDFFEDLVRPETVQQAIRLIDYFKSHSARVHHHMASKQSRDRMTQAARYVVEMGGTVTQREVLTAKLCGVRTSEEAVRLMKEMAQVGLGSMEQTRKNQHQFTLNDATA